MTTTAPTETHPPVAPGAHTRAELLSQPTAWAEALAHLGSQLDDLRAFYADGRFEQIVVTGCGSPYYAALSVAATMREIGLNAVAAPASEVGLDPRTAYLAGRRTLLVVLSRSGETTELLRACTAFRERSDGAVVTITCTPGSSLSTVGDRNLVLASGREESFAQTRAFTVMLIAGLACAAAWANDAALRAELALLPTACARVIADCAELMKTHGANPAFDRFYFLGSGARHGLACEVSLKMKEMSISHSEPFHFLEFRHGPQTMAAPSALVVGMVSRGRAAHENAVLADMRALGATALAIGEAGDAALPAGIGDAARGPLYVVAGQLLALEHALALGRNPDRPHNLHAVVKLG
jgi:glucosamine--fructose-6-phosphate aminotransferase (isomerizing)